MRLFRKKYKYDDAFKGNFNAFEEAKKSSFWPEYPCHAFFEATFKGKELRGEFLPSFDHNLIAEFHKAMEKKCLKAN